MSTTETLPPLYATKTVSVRGKLYRAGEEIANPGGSRGPLLQFGQASLKPPRKRRSDDEDSPSESGDESGSEKKSPESSDNKKASKKTDDKKTPDKTPAKT